MNKIMAVVEGPSERNFLMNVLAPWMWEKSEIELVASAAGKPGHKGGNAYDKVKMDIVNYLKNKHFAHVTTMFDYYGMSPKWPGRIEAESLPYVHKAKTIQDAIRQDIEDTIGSDRIQRLIPYVQMHEYEGLLFADTSKLPIVMDDQQSKLQLDEIRAAFASPEEINDSPSTAPSKRLEAIYPTYHKPLHGYLAAQQISIDVIIQECPFFSLWVTRLLSAGPHGDQFRSKDIKPEVVQ